MGRGLAIDRGGQGQHHLPHHSRRPHRCTSSVTRRLSGPTPSSAESSPPSTWKRPRNAPPRSMAQRAPTSSTTQIMVAGPASRPSRWRRPRPYPARRRRCRAAPSAAASAMAWARGVSSWSRFFRSASAARRAERGPHAGKLGEQGDQPFDLGSGGGGHQAGCKLHPGHRRVGAPRQNATAAAAWIAVVSNRGVAHVSACETRRPISVQPRITPSAP